MDLFSLGMPFVEIFAKPKNKLFFDIGIEKNDLNIMAKEEIDFLEKKLQGNILYRYFGDNCRNVCEGFAALGGFAAFQGEVGTDKEAIKYEANLQNCSIASFLEKTKGNTGKMIIIETKEKTYCLDYGVSGQCNKHLDIIKNSKIFFTTTNIFASDFPIANLAKKYMQEAKKLGKLIAISAEDAKIISHKHKEVEKIIEKYADVLFLNEKEAEALLKENTSKNLKEFKPEIPIYLKLGPKGSHLFYKKKVKKIPPLKAKVIDPSGAGDAYAAGVLYGISRNYTYEGSAKIGCMLSTKVIKKIDSSIPHPHTRIRIKHN